VPKSIWPQFKEQLAALTKALKVGPPDDFGNFIGPVIHKASFEKLSKVIDDAKNDNSLELLVGGSYDGSKGFYIHPTVYVSKTPDHELFSRELFGPIMVVYVYDDTADPVKAFQDICRTIDSATDYALTGAVFATDRAALRYAEDALRNSAGNFYLNCKSTGAVVAQQPFGGARASGTNESVISPNLSTSF
jgi:1-pyrroline-5-carboxylate dehydrogenase